MDKSEKIRIARKAVTKHMDFETLKYSDYLYGRTYNADDVWEYVVECNEIGAVAFDLKYAAELGRATSGCARGIRG